MTEMIKYPKIQQFRDVIRDVQYYTFTKNAKRDSDGNIIDDRSFLHRQPTLYFNGTVKVHGTNASWVYDTETKEITAQSRNRILTPGNDNAGFATWTEANKDKIKMMFDKYNLENVDKVVIYGEWCGPGIQTGVAVNELKNKIFIAFESYFIKKDDSKTYLDARFTFIPDDMENVYKIIDFPSYSVKIDFNNPKLIQNELIRITEEVEKECPVGKQFGISGIGEGVVWTSSLADGGMLRFKVKGEKHSVTKVKTIAPVDIEKLKGIMDFVDSVVTENRLNQGLDYLTEMNKEHSVKSTGDYLRWFVNDVNTEEAATITENGYDGKMLNRELSKGARIWFHNKVNQI